MGYTTWFTGRVTVVPPLNGQERDYLTRFGGTRRMHRTKGPYFVGGGGHAGQDIEPDVVSGSGPPPEQPGLWCQWVSTEDGSAIEWNGAEKFYDADLWLAYLVDTFLAPDAGLARELADPVPGRVYPADFTHFSFDHVVNGVIQAEGEEPDDRWRIEVRDNVVYVIRYAVEPAYDEIHPADPGEWSEAEWAEFGARTRHHVAFVVRGRRLEEVAPADGVTFDPVDPPDGH